MMEKLRLEPLAREITLVRKLIPTEFREVESLIPVRFDVHTGRLIPVEFKRVRKYIPVNFMSIEVPIFMPTGKDSTSRRF